MLLRVPGGLEGPPQSPPLLGGAPAYAGAPLGSPWPSQSRRTTGDRVGLAAIPENINIRIRNGELVVAGRAGVRGGRSSGRARNPSGSARRPSGSTRTA